MYSYWQTFIDSFTGYGRYLWSEITHPSWHNYFYWLIAISLFFMAMEWLMPWRKNQKLLRRDFWLDAFYMFFNFFLFSLIGFNAISNIGVKAFNDFLGLFGIHNLVAIEIQSWPVWVQLLTLFIVRDFVHWNVHRLLHRVPFLWEFHKVHHSVKEMGFAAHLRYHWMETVVYRTIEYIPLAMIGFGIQDFIIVYLFSLAIGHFNHSNIRVPLGPFKYIFNHPDMHIWHHAKKVPQRHGVNFGISLSLWDYLFGTAYVPYDGRDEELGFSDEAGFPEDFVHQVIYGFKHPHDQPEPETELRK